MMHHIEILKRVLNLVASVLRLNLAFPKTMSVQAAEERSSVHFAILPGEETQTSVDCLSSTAWFPGRDDPNDKSYVRTTCNCYRCLATLEKDSGLFNARRPLLGRDADDDDDDGSADQSANTFRSRSMATMDVLQSSQAMSRSMSAPLPRAVSPAESDRKDMIRSRRTLMALAVSAAKLVDDRPKYARLKGVAYDLVECMCAYMDAVNRVGGRIPFYSLQLAEQKVLARLYEPYATQKLKGCFSNIFQSEGSLAAYQHPSADQGTSVRCYAVAMKTVCLLRSMRAHGISEGEERVRRSHNLPSAVNFAVEAYRLGFESRSRLAEKIKSTFREIVAPEILRTILSIK